MSDYYKDKKDLLRIGWLVGLSAAVQILLIFFFSPWVVLMLGSGSIGLLYLCARIRSIDAPELSSVSVRRL